MTTGTIIMIVCAVLYGLILIFFKEDNIVVEDDESEHFSHGLFTGADGVEGSAPGLFNDEVGVFGNLFNDE